MEGEVLTALQVREELFDTLEEILGTAKRKQAFIEVKPGRKQKEIAESAGASVGTINGVISDLKDLGLARETEDGYEKTLRCMDHPVLEHLWRKEVLADE